MFDKIIYLSDSIAYVSLISNINLNLINAHAVFEDSEKTIVGEIEDINDKVVRIRFLGEFSNDKFISGTIKKPLLNAKIRLIREDEIPFILGVNSNESVFIGTSPIYNNSPVFGSVNDLFSNHMAIFGSPGSGKTYGIARLIQNVFENPKMPPYKAIFIMFDIYGEYQSAFQSINKINQNFNFKSYSKNNELRIPAWFLNARDLALLLHSSSYSEFQILEKALKLVKVIVEKNADSYAYQEYLIARTIINIMHNNQSAMSKRNDILTILNTCPTPSINADTVVNSVSYAKRLRDCFIVDQEGRFVDIALINAYLSTFLNPAKANYNPASNNPYTLSDIEKALDFALITDGVLNNSKSYEDGVALKVKLHNLIDSNVAEIFNYDRYVDFQEYISSLISVEGKRAQIINFNLEGFDDVTVGNIINIYSRIFFEFAKSNKIVPINVFIEDAHKYIKNDLFGFNLFEHIAKEGTKYGLTYGFISSIPTELTGPVISQCKNFFIFKMVHPRDIEFAQNIIPNIDSRVMEKQKNLQCGSCIAFGTAFKIPQIVQMPNPNPKPQSSTADITSRWK